MITAPIINMGKSIEDVGVKTGVTLSLITIGAVTGTPISGRIQAHSGGFHHVGYYAGEYRPLTIKLDKI